MVPLFGNLTISGISRNFCGKILYQVPLLPNFRKFSLNWKAPQEVFEKFNQAQFPLGSKVAILRRHASSFLHISFTAHPPTTT